MGGVKVKVRCTFDVEVEVPDDWDDGLIRFDIEENSCPNTHGVGSVVNPIIEAGMENGTCWACALQATNTVLSIERGAPGAGAA